MKCSGGVLTFCTLIAKQYVVGLIFQSAIYCNRLSQFGRQALIFNLFFHIRNWAENLTLLQILDYGVASRRLFWNSIFKHPSTRDLGWASISASLHFAAGDWGLFVLFHVFFRVSPLVQSATTMSFSPVSTVSGSGVPLVQTNLGWAWVAI
jgi:hypothetical protein